VALLSDLELASAPDRASGRKARGLARLVAHGFATPEFVLLDDDELQAWSAERRLSGAVRPGLEALLDRTVRSGETPLFSIRCEATSAATSARPPPTILNVGLAGLRARRSPPGISPAALASTHEQRVALFEQRHGPARVTESEDVLATLCAWIERMFQALAGTAGSFSSRNLVVQRMVFGCADERSGNGICCNLPEPAPDGRFRGVFLPGQQGIPAIRGAWGDPQVDLRELQTINPGAYRELARIFDRLESLAPDPYLEFTVQGSSLYCMQYEQRRRHVVVD
jgi:hypothetical protein